MGDTRTGVVLEQKVYDWMCSHADGDGFVEASTPAIALHLGHPERTTQYAVRRLEDKGKVVCLARRRYAVVALADLDDSE